MKATQVLTIEDRNRRIPLYCIFCCSRDGVEVTVAKVVQHSIHYGYRFGAAHVICPETPSCNSTHVSVTTNPSDFDIAEVPFLSIENEERRDENFPYNLTVCISNVLGAENNNALQFIQMVEMYKLLGVQKMVIYNTTCGPDLRRMLHYYQDEGFLEIVMWPISNFLVPATGWKFKELKGDLHNYGQITVMNDCIYRNMYRSRYVLLADMDQIIMPYEHTNLLLVLQELQKQHTNVTVFLFENNIFPTTLSDQRNRFYDPVWKAVPGVNMLKHIYRIPVSDGIASTKMIVNPRAIEQTAVFTVLKMYGATLHVPPNMSRVMQITDPELGDLSMERLILDERIWDFEELLIPRINEVVHKTMANYSF
ncbi:uncharacterized protein LOC115815358 [Chanos chanos]|uniref:Glycosyltransferase family 92 protein n=1 Tax=Chanos chanos TaxID=29144 RepID=A0A6J2VMJ7_CHACN|nr:uncharacterized protein LOC115815358 [Chanos chanos]